MTHFNRFLLLAAFLLPTTGGAFGQASAALSVSLSRQDQKSVAITAYPPKNTPCRGQAIISPGAGGSEKGYAYLGEAMSSLGYMAVVVGHQESGRRALREHVRGNGLRDGLAELVSDPVAYRGRFMDIAAAQQWAQAKCNANESILLGHSMGAATVMLEAGARNQLGLTGSNAFKLYIALSPQGVGSIFPSNAWSDVQRPVLSITGTNDKELGGLSWEKRTEPYMNMPAGCKWLGVIEGASHMNLAGSGMSRKTEALVTQTITAFLDGIHRGDCKLSKQNQGIELQAK